MTCRTNQSGIVLIGLCLSLAVGLAADAGEPEWVWTSKPSPVGESAYFRKEFSIEKRIIKAELCCVSDFNRSTVFLDGLGLGDVPNFSLPMRIDLTGKL